MTVNRSQSPTAAGGKTLVAIFMKRPYITILILTVTALFACQTQRKLYQLYQMDDFNLSEGYRFIEKIQYLPTIQEISIVDTKADGNDFVVNRQWIFLDTTKQDQPNYYSVKKRANELNVNSDSVSSPKNSTG